MITSLFVLQHLRYMFVQLSIFLFDIIITNNLFTILG